MCGPIMSSNAIPIVGACQRAVAAPRFHSHSAHLCSSPPGCSSRGQLSRPQLSLAYSAPTQGRLLIAYSRNHGTALMHGEGGDEVAPPGLGGPTSARVSLHARARAPASLCERAHGRVGARGHLSAWTCARASARADAGARARDLRVRRGQPCAIAVGVVPTLKTAPCSARNRSGALTHANWVLNLALFLLFSQ